MAETSHPTTAEICDALGRSTIAAHLKVRVTAVSNAVTDGKFPARWFLVMSKLCEDHGLLCPKELFTFVPSPSSNQENSHDLSQPDASSDAA